MLSSSKLIFLISLFSCGAVFANKQELASFDNAGACSIPCHSNRRLCGDLAITGEFLYWQPKVTGMYYAATNTLIPTPIGALADDVEYQAVKFNYEPGFRLDATYTFPGSGWDVSLTWTRFETSGSDSVNATADIFISTFWEQLSTVTASTASSNLNVDFQSVYLNLGKQINLFKRFHLHPYCGISYYKLDLNNNINYVGIFAPTDDPAEANILLQDYADGWGLNIGTESIWNLGCGFGLYGLGEYSIFASSCNNTITQASSVPAVPIDLTFVANNDYRTFQHTFRIGCGLSWNYTFNVKSNPIDITILIGYEINYLPEQVQLNRSQFSGLPNTLVPLEIEGDVGFHGLTTGVTVSF